MAAFSDYLETAILNHTLRNSALTAPATVYVALYTADPTDAGTGTEVSGGSYARQAVTFGAPSGGACTNSAEVTFPTATAGWGAITHFGIRDASTAGNLLYHGALAASKTVNSGDVIKFNASAITITLAFERVYDFITAPFRAVADFLDGLGGKIRDALGNLNPFERHSPSLVDNVIAGVDVIRREYAKLNGIMLPRVSNFIPTITAAGGGGGGVVINGDIYLPNVTRPDQFARGLKDDITMRTGRRPA